MRNILLIAAILCGMLWIDGRYFDGRCAAFAIREASYRTFVARVQLSALWVWIERTV